MYELHCEIASQLDWSVGSRIRQYRSLSVILMVMFKYIFTVAVHSSNSKSREQIKTSGTILLLFSFEVNNKRHLSLKLDLCNKNNLQKTKDKNLVWNQYTLFDSSRFIHSDCESSPVKMSMPTGEHCWKKNSGTRWARTSHLCISSLTRSPLRYLGRYVKWDLNTVLYIAKQKRSTEGCSKFKGPETRQVQERLVSTLEHMQVPKWDRTRCPEE